MKRMVDKAERLEKMAEKVIFEPESNSIDIYGNLQVNGFITTSGDPELVRSIDFLENIEQPMAFFNKAVATLFDLGEFLAFKIEISGSGTYSPFTKALFIDFTQDLVNRNGDNLIWQKTHMDNSFMQEQFSGIEKIDYLTTNSGEDLGLKVYFKIETPGGGGGTNIDYYIFPKGLH